MYLFKKMCVYLEHNKNLPSQKSREIRNFTWSRKGSCLPDSWMQCLQSPTWMTVLLSDSRENILNFSFKRCWIRCALWSIPTLSLRANKTLTCNIIFCYRGSQVSLIITVKREWKSVFQNNVHSVECEVSFFIQTINTGKRRCKIKYLIKCLMVL